MRLSDVFEHLSLDVYPVTALVLFVFAFAVILYRVWKMSKGESARHGRLPLEDDTPQEPRNPHPRNPHPRHKEATR